MKKIKIDPTNVTYPVGSRINEALKFGRILAEKLMEEIPTNDTDLIFVCRGSSGSILSSMTAAFMPNYNIIIYYIHKDEEFAHGTASYTAKSRIAQNRVDKRDYKIIIIDDFVASGHTVNEIYSALRDRINVEKVDYLCLSRVFKCDLNSLKFKPDNVIGNFRR